MTKPNTLIHFHVDLKTNRAFKGFTTELCYLEFNWVSNGEMSGLLNIFPIIDLSMNMISCLNVKVDEIVAWKDHITDSFISITDWLWLTELTGHSTKQIECPVKAKPLSREPIRSLIQWTLGKSKWVQDQMNRYTWKSLLCYFQTQSNCTKHILQLCMHHCIIVAVV